MLQHLLPEKQPKNARYLVAVALAVGETADNTRYLVAVALAAREATKTARCESSQHLPSGRQLKKPHRIAAALAAGEAATLTPNCYQSGPPRLCT